MRLLPIVITGMLVLVPQLSWSLSDPTRPQDLPVRPAGLAASATPEIVEPSYLLQYVLISGERRHAVINGERVREGDRVGDAKVLRINPGVVLIRAAGKVSELKLGFKDIKRQGRMYQ